MFTSNLNYCMCLKIIILFTFSNKPSHSNFIFFFPVHVLDYRTIGQKRKRHAAFCFRTMMRYG